MLVGGSVVPGFELADFTLIDPASEDALRLIAFAPEMARFIKL
jgi:predicted cupin superfamily sugar epimerase